MMNVNVILPLFEEILTSLILSHQPFTDVCVITQDTLSQDL